MVSAKLVLIAGSVFGFLSVALGAFGAHAFKEYLVQTNRLATYETAVQYQMYHALALLLVGILCLNFPEAKAELAGMFFIAGIVVFSGSLYILCVTGMRWLGAITPIGGVCFLVGWALLFWRFVKM